MNFTDNFTLDELTFSETAIRKGLDNVPDADTIENLKVLAQNLERIQTLLGFPIHINSAYRSPKTNAAVGGSTNSAHMEGYAADIVCKEFGSPLDICKAIASGNIPFDQIIQEGTWCHFSCDPKMRGQTLTAHFGNGVLYTDGL